jgi:hypothetical protein
MIRRSKYGAVTSWACTRCGADCDAPPQIGKAKTRSTKPEHRTCPRCRTVTVRCFASKRERKWLSDLLIRQRVGEIRNLEVQPCFPLVIEGTAVGRYTADFAWFEGNTRRIVDVKGEMLADAAFRIKVAEALYRMKVEIVK